MKRRLLTYSFSLLNADYVKLDAQWNYTNVISPYYRMYYIDAGSGVLADAQHALALQPGYLYLVPSFTLCSYHTPEFLGQHFIQFFEDSVDKISLFHANRTVMQLEAGPSDIEQFKRLLAINPGRGLYRSDNPRIYEKDIYYKEYQELNNRQSLPVYLETQGILMQLISRFLSPALFKAGQLENIPFKIMEAISYIQLNLHQPLSVNHLAERANQHPDYFSRVFLEYTGARPVKYIQDKRIERAQYLITTMNLPYAEIAQQTGFEHLPYFSKLFKRITGLTPGEYRRQHQLFNRMS